MSKIQKVLFVESVLAPTQRQFNTRQIALKASGVRNTGYGHQGCDSLTEMDHGIMAVDGDFERLYPWHLVAHVDYSLPNQVKANEGLRKIEPWTPPADYVPPVVANPDGRPQTDLEAAQAWVAMRNSQILAQVEEPARKPAPKKKAAPKRAAGKKKAN